MSPWESGKSTGSLSGSLDKGLEKRKPAVVCLDQGLRMELDSEEPLSLDISFIGLYNPVFSEGRDLDFIGRHLDGLVV